MLKQLTEREYMNICVFGAASSTIDQKYINAGERIGYKLAKRGHRLVFGGGKDGMMGAIARGFRRGSGYIIGIIPEFFKTEGRFEELYKDCDETIYTKDIAQRISGMEEMSDAFLALPGGGGTYEEFFKILVSKSLDRHNKPLAVFNIEGYFDPMIRMLEYGEQENFISNNAMNNFRVFDETQIEDFEKYAGDNKTFH